MSNTYNWQRIWSRLWGKCELFVQSGTNQAHFKIPEAFHEISPSIRIVRAAELTLFGFPVLDSRLLKDCKMTQIRQSYSYRDSQLFRRIRSFFCWKIASTFPSFSTLCVARQPRSSRMHWTISTLLSGRQHRRSPTSIFLGRCGIKQQCQSATANLDYEQPAISHCQLISLHLRHSN